MAFASTTRYRAVENGQVLEGQSDGVFYDSYADRLVLMKAGVVEHVFNGPAQVREFIDFNGKAFDTSGVWTTANKTAAAGSPTAAVQTNAKNGTLLITLANNNEVEEMPLSFGDQLSINSNDKPILKARLKIPTAITTAQFVCIGFGSATASGVPDNVANNAWIRLAASMVPKLESDDATTDNNTKATDQTVTLTADTFYEFMVDMTYPTAVRFYYRATVAGAWTELTTSGTTFTFGANIACQPYVCLGKSTGTTTPTMEVDYVEVVWNRAVT